LRRYIKADISYEDAAKVINQTRAQKEVTQASFLAAGGSNLGGLRQQYLNLLKFMGEPKSREHAVAEFNYKVLKLQLNRHFRNKKQTKDDVF
jgi:hypothetical protein